MTANTTELAQRIAELPELPDPFEGCVDVWPEYTADQMQSYALAAQAPLVERIRELEAALKHAQEMTAVEAVVAVKWQRKSDELEKQNAELLKVLRIALPCAEIDAALASSQQQTGGV